MNEPPSPTTAQRPTANVIHVSFTQRRVLRPEAPAPAAPFPPSPESPAADPVSRVYTRGDVARILGVSEKSTRSWERAGLLRASAEEKGAARFTFGDLLSARAVRDLQKQTVPLKAIRRALEGLRRVLPGVRSLAEVRVRLVDGKLLVRDEGGDFEAASGQRLLDFTARSVRAAVLRALPVQPRPRGETRTAYEWFLEGCRLDGDEAARPRAEGAYRRALALDPTLAAAHTNLGMLLIASGQRAEAETCFVRAMQHDAGLPEAPYNLAWLLLEQRRFHEAISCLERTLTLEPEFADAHVNLALALEALDRFMDAVPHWRAYLALEPTGSHAHTARGRLGRKIRE